jgi:hypothetical protein
LIRRFEAIEIFAARGLAKPSPLLPFGAREAVEGGGIFGDRCRARVDAAKLLDNPRLSAARATVLAGDTSIDDDDVSSI